jgi:hypothetical protein
MLGGGVFMTELVRHGIPPSAFGDDLRLHYTADTPYLQVDDVDDGLVRFLGLPVYLWFFVLGLAVVDPGTVIAVRRVVRARRESAAASP